MLEGVGEFEPIRPHRKDRFVFRSRVQVRVDDSIVDRIDLVAKSLHLSRAHFCDLVLAIAVEEGGPWLRAAITRRLEKAFEKRQAEWE